MLHCRPENKEATQTVSHEYQHNCQVRLKAEAEAKSTKLIAPNQTTTVTNLHGFVVFSP